MWVSFGDGDAYITSCIDCHWIMNQGWTFVRPMWSVGLEVLGEMAAAGLTGRLAGVAKSARMGTTAARGTRIARSGAKPGTEMVQRWMSRAELDATKATGLLRGGRPGTHHVTDAANKSAQGAWQRLALPTRPGVRVTLEVPIGRFSAPTRVLPQFNMPGGGMERMATGSIPVRIVRVQ